MACCRKITKCFIQRERSLFSCFFMTGLALVLVLVAVVHSETERMDESIIRATSFSRRGWGHCIRCNAAADDDNDDNNEDVEWSGSNSIGESSLEKESVSGRLAGG